MSMYKQFKTDHTLENKGVELDYGEFIVTIARAGGSNKRYSRLLEAKTQPHRRSIQTDTMQDAKAEEIMYEVYAEAVVIDWQTRVDGKLKKGIEAQEGDALLPLTTANIVKTFQNLPDLFLDIKDQANKVSLFREAVREDDAKN